jgi:hypothetical protein
MREIRRLIIAGTPHRDIQRQLNLPEKTHYRYLNECFKEDRKRLSGSITKDEILNQIIIAEERFTEIYKNLHYGMACNSEIEPDKRIQAEDMAAQVVVGILKMWIEASPTSTANELRNNNIISSNNNNTKPKHTLYRTKRTAQTLRDDITFERECRRLLFLFKRILLFAAAAIPRHQAPQTTHRIHARLYNSLVEPSFAK